MFILQGWVVPSWVKITQDKCEIFIQFDIISVLKAKKKTFQIFLLTI